MTATVFSVNRMISAASSSLNRSSRCINRSSASSAIAVRSASSGKQPAAMCPPMPFVRFSSSRGRRPNLRRLTRLVNAISERQPMRFAAVTLAALAITGIAAAAPAWTPTRVAATLQTMIPLTHGTSLWLAHGFIKQPSCQATKTAYTCTATLTAGLKAEKVALYVKPWDASRLCVSRTGAAVCLAPLMPQDPRLCGRYTADGCLLNAARSADLKARGPGLSPVCTPAGPMRFTCDNGARTVSFVNNGQTLTAKVTG